MIELDLSGIPNVKAGRSAYEKLADEAYTTLVQQTGEGSEMTGWLQVSLTGGIVLYSSKKLHQGRDFIRKWFRLYPIL